MGGGLGGEGEERNGINMELATRPSDTVGVGEDNTNEVDIILTGGGSSVSTSSKVSDAARTDEAGMSAVLTISLSPGDSTTGELPGTDMARLRRTFFFAKHVLPFVMCLKTPSRKWSMSCTSWTFDLS